MITTEETLATIERFNEAFNRHDADALMDLMTGDIFFESTADGTGCFAGQEAARAVFEQFFEAIPGGWFDTEEIFAVGDRCVVRWLFTSEKGKLGSTQLCGVDVFRVRDGRVAEKFSYAKTAQNRLLGAWQS